MHEDENDKDPSLVIKNTDDEEIERQSQYEQYQAVEYTGRKNPWDLVMWGLTKAHPNLAKTAELGRLIIAKPLGFIGNGLYKVYQFIEGLTGAKSGFTEPFATLLGTVVKGILTGNETESRLDNFETVTKTRKISDVADGISNEAKKIPQAQTKHVNNNSKSLNRHIQPNTYATNNHINSKNNQSNELKTPSVGSHVNALKNNKQSQRNIER